MSAESMTETFKTDQRFIVLFTRWYRPISRGLVQWVAEAFVGLVPWLAYVVTQRFSSNTEEATGLCLTQTYSTSLEPGPRNLHSRCRNFGLVSALCRAVSSRSQEIIKDCAYIPPPSMCARVTDCWRNPLRAYRRPSCQGYRDSRLLCACRRPAELALISPAGIRVGASKTPRGASRPPRAALERRPRCSYG
jgi:hypothetical protein